MVALTRRQHFTPIGLNIRDWALEAVQCSVREGRIRLYAAVAWPLDFGGTPEGKASAVLASLKALLKEGVFAGRKTVSCLSGSAVDIRLLRLAGGVTPEQDEEFREALALEARSCLPYSPEEAQLDYLPFGTEIEDGEEKFSLLLVAARRDNVNRHLALLKEAGLDCVYIEAAPCALARAFCNEEATSAFVDMDSESTIVSVAKRGSLLFSRTIPFGVQRIVEDLAGNLKLPLSEARRILRFHGLGQDGPGSVDPRMPAQTGRMDERAFPAMLLSACGRSLMQVAREVKRSLEYCVRQRRGQTIEKVVLTGASIPAGVENYLNQHLGMPVAVGDALSRLAEDLDAGKGERMDRALYLDPAVRSSFATAMGLALRDEL